MFVSSEYRITEVRGGSSCVVEVRNIFAQKATARVQKGGARRAISWARARCVCSWARARRVRGQQAARRGPFFARGGADGDGRSLGEVLTE
jgi:hypothetical protein